MQDLALRTYVALENMPLRLRDTLADEDGQTGAEYIGIIAFVAAVAIALLAYGDTIAGVIVGKVQEIISGL
jgi:Flp pilus assembly pilin Flp